MTTQLTAGRVRLTGVSLGGVYTALALPQYGIAFDVGHALREHIPYEHLFLTHCHSDHVGALISFLGMRDLMGARPLTIYVIDEEAKLVRDTIDLASRLGRYQPRVSVVALNPGDSVSVGRGLRVHAFAAHHVLPCLGYQVRRTTKKLRPEFLGTDGAEIRRLKSELAESDMFYVSEVNEFSFVTDTTADVFGSVPSILESDVLACESTFLCDEYGPDRARNYSHMHASEIHEAMRAFKGSELVLTHFSLVYSPKMAQAHIQRIFADAHYRAQGFVPENSPDHWNW